MLAVRRPRYEGIDPKTWEHPADKAALSAVKQLKGVDEVFKLLLSLTSERSMKLLMLASSVKVSDKQYSKIDTIINEIVYMFDWNYKPDVFVTQSPIMNAGVLGVKEPFIIINSAIIKNSNEKEIKALIAHEMGHIMSGHSLYKTVIWLLTNISTGILPIPGIVIYGLLLAMSEWDRKSELTADRVELLALQESTPSYTLLMKLAGADDISQVNINEFFNQAKEYEDQKTLVDSIHKLLNSAWISHPYPVIRLQELKAWEMSGYYEQIVDGNYLRRNVFESSFEAEAKEAYDYYRDEMSKSDDPILRTINGIGIEIEDVMSKIKPELDNMKKAFENELSKTVDSLRSGINDFLNKSKNDNTD